MNESRMDPIMLNSMLFAPWLKDMSSSRREERPMRKLSGSWRRFVSERVSLVRALREAKAVARLVSTSKCEKHIQSHPDSLVFGNRRNLDVK